MSDRVSTIERINIAGWAGDAHDAMARRTGRLRHELASVPAAVSDAQLAMERFAEAAEYAECQRARSDDLLREASNVTRRWRADPEPSPVDPGTSLRWRASRTRADADEFERAAAAGAARTISVAANTIRSRPNLSGPATHFGMGILDGIGDMLDDVADTIGDGLEWGWDRTTDLAGWVADQAEHVVDGVVWVKDAAIDVGQSVVQRFVDEARVAYARARFPVDFALFHATGDTPDGLPGISEEYRRSQNAWSYSLIPVIEAGGGECTQLDNGIFACRSDGIELPGDLATIPLKGRGGTTYGEVFIVDRAATYEAVQAPDSPLAEHEKNHSIQWALHGPVPFVALYLADVAMSGNNGADQYFEHQAGAEEGGYD